LNPAPSSRVLALDYGSARCGCAVSDPSGTLATPLEAVKDPGSDAGLRRLAQLVSEYGAGAVVVGLPVGLSGSEGPQAQEARRFAARLRERLDVPVETYDERFTTTLARRSGGRTPEDSRAAAHMLTDYLASKANGRPEPK
jgi:putative Holliday junction resolvase